MVARSFSRDIKVEFDFYSWILIEYKGLVSAWERNNLNFDADLERLIEKYGIPINFTTFKFKDNTTLRKSTRMIASGLNHLPHYLIQKMSTMTEPLETYDIPFFEAYSNNITFYKHFAESFEWLERNLSSRFDNEKLYQSLTDELFIVAEARIKAKRDNIIDGILQSQISPPTNLFLKNEKDTLTFEYIANCIAKDPYSFGDNFSTDALEKFFAERKFKVDTQYMNPMRYFLGWCYHKARGLNQDKLSAIKFYKDAVKAGFLPAKIKLGRFYEKGKLNLKKDTSQALDYYLEGLRAGDTHAQYYLGLSLLNGMKDSDTSIMLVKPDKQRGMKLILRAAENHDKAAAKWLAMFYDPSIKENSGPHKSFQEAKKWYDLIDKNNVIATLCNTGLNYILNLEVDYNAIEAFSLLSKACQHNAANDKYNRNKLAKANYYLAWLFATGDGTDFNQEQALYWLKQAITNGYDAQQCQLIENIIKIPNLTELIKVYANLPRVSTNTKDWQHCFELAMFLDTNKTIFINAQVRASYWLSKGYNLAQQANQLDKLSGATHYFLYEHFKQNSPQQRTEMLEKVSTHGEFAVQHGYLAKTSLGDFYYEIASEKFYLEGNKRNIPLAMKYFQKAAAFGRPDAYNQLGDIYAHRNFTKPGHIFHMNYRDALVKSLESAGVGNSRNFFRAKEYFEKAIENGCILGKLGLAELYWHGHVVKKDKKHAIKLCKEVAKAGYVEGILEQAVFYYHGPGENHSKARKLYKLAAEKGSIQAQYFSNSFRDSRSCNIM